ncbi:hypothetical protein [Hymenobacter sp. B81]|uniref:hypothetical protein n=1 Tax=Hymenobacter sp. B81 TaxID=3344878 RepID=UPI0037DCD0D4
MKAFVSLLMLGLGGVLIGGTTLRLKMYGEAHNDQRKHLGIPLVEADWQAHYSRSNGTIEFFGDNVYGLGHVRKRIQINYLNGIEKESDLYVFKGVTMDLDYTYGQKKPWDISYYRGAECIQLTYQQAMDSLATLSRKL